MSLDIENFVVDKGGGSSGLKDTALLKKLWPFVQPHQKLIWFSVALLLPATIAQVSLPMIVKNALDGPIQNQDWPGLMGMAGLYLLAMAVFLFCKHRLMIWSQMAGQNIIYDLRTRLYEHLQKLPRAFYHKTPIGKLVTRITSDVENLSEMFSSGAVSILLDTTVIVGVLVAMFIQQWVLTGITVVMMGVILLVIELLRRRVRQKTDEVRVKVAAMNAYLQENFSGMEVVQLNRRERQNLKDFNGINDSNLKSNLAQVFYECSLAASVEFLSTLTLIVILAVSGYMLTNPGFASEISFGLLVAFFIYIQMIFSPIEDLAEKYVIVQSGLASIDKIMALLNETPQKIYADFQSVSDASQKIQGEVIFKQVKFGYQPAFPVLKDVSFTIKPGQTMAIVGPTGTGKTTVIKLLMGFYQPDDGQIVIDGQPHKNWNVFELRRQMVTIQQDDVIFSRSVAENVTLNPTEATDPQRQEAILNALQTVNSGGVLDSFIANSALILEERGKNLSAGEKQLLLFARAVYHDPAILVLDEATSAIDPHTEIYVQQAMEKLMVGRTTIVIAHRLSTIEKADKILVLKDGFVAEEGTHQQLLEGSGLYAQYQHYSVLTNRLKVQK